MTNEDNDLPGRGVDPACSKDLKRYFYLIAVVALIVLFGALIYRQSSGSGLRLNQLWEQLAHPGAAANAPAQPAHAGMGQDGMGQPSAVTVATPGGVMTAPPSGFAGMATLPPEVEIGPATVAARGNFSNIVTVLRNSVVSVTASSGTAPNDPTAVAGLPPDGQAHFATPQTRSVENIGTGVILRNDGYVLTNYHVVRGANTIFVTVNDDVDSTRYAADIVKMDEALDLALIKLSPKEPLTAAVLGDSGAVHVADEVIAIGSPFGLDMTVSRGIISAKRKSMVIEGVTHTNLLQTDAAINQGNSGGPLVDRSGAVIGINTAIYTPNGAFAGIGFAVPSNQARMFAIEEIGWLPTATAGGPQFGLVAFPQAGGGRGGSAIIAGIPAPHRDGREKMNCSSCHTIVPADGAVTPAMVPAAFLGRGGSAITAGAPAPHTDGRENMNCAACHTIVGAGGGAATSNPNMLQAAATGLPPPPIAMGTLSPHTDGRETMDCAMCHKMLPAFGVPAAFAGGAYRFAQPRSSLAMNATGPQVQGGAHDITVQGATLRSSIEAGSGPGVNVVRVALNSAAATSGLKVGDILLKVDGRPVRTPREVAAILAGMSPGRSVRLGVQRDGDVRGVDLPIGAAQAAFGFGANAFGLPIAAPGSAAPGAVAVLPAIGAAAAPVLPAAPTEFNWLGLEVEVFQPITPVAGAPPSVVIKGAVVGDVTPGTRGAMAGLRVNDVILEINNQPVPNAAHFAAAIGGTSGAGAAAVLIRANRNGQEFLVVM